MRARTPVPYKTKHFSVPVGPKGRRRKVRVGYVHLTGTKPAQVAKMRKIIRKAVGGAQ